MIIKYILTISSKKHFGESLQEDWRSSECKIGLLKDPSFHSVSAVRKRRNRMEGDKEFCQHNKRPTFHEPLRLNQW